MTSNKRLTVVLLTAASSLVAAACGDDRACTLNAAPSIMLQLEPPPPSAVVYFRVDNSAEEQVACDEDGPNGCDSLSVGWETAGHFDLRIEGEGYTTVEIGVDVPQGQCHVDTQSVTVRLDSI